MGRESDKDMFFRNPVEEPNLPGKLSVLYLLRRDIEHCITTQQMIWPATMAILAGIDLLGKFHAGEDNTGKGAGKGGKRFKNFVTQYFVDSLSLDDAEIIYQLRNALLHSFGLYSNANNKEYRFTLVFTEESPWIQRLPGNVYLISITVLHKKFEIAIERYHIALKADNDLQDKFTKMFPNYGAVDLFNPL